MPYTVSQLQADERFKGMPKHALEIFAAAFNAASAAGNPEARCFQIAWAAVKEKYHRTAEGAWVEFAVEMGRYAEATNGDDYYKRDDGRWVLLTDDVEREAKLFEAGDYPDKGVSITEEELDAMVAAHPAEGVPIKVEHSETPFDGALGTVQAIYRRGKELFGKIRFPRSAWDFLEAAGAKALSCGVKRDKTGITEVSIVCNPRVADARIFADTAEAVRFSADVEWDGHPAKEETSAVPKSSTLPPKEGAEEVKPMPEDGNREITFEAALEVVRKAAEADDARAQVVKSELERTAYFKQVEESVQRVAAREAELDMHFRRTNAEGVLGQFKRAGKIVPVSEKLARALLSELPLVSTFAEPAHVIKFTDKDGNEQTAHFAEVFKMFLEASPACVSYAEMIRNEKEADLGATAEQVKFAEAHGVSKEDLAKYAGR